MKALEKKIQDALTMSCKQISVLTGVRHDSVKRTIESLVKKGVIESPQSVEVKTRTNKRLDNVFVGEQGERDSIIVIAQVSPEATAQLVDEWKALKVEVARLKIHAANRSAAKLEAPELTIALKGMREQEGKETKGFHYSNEYNMINKIVLGFTSKQYAKEHGLQPSDSIRDTMRPVEIEAITALQRANTNLIDMGIEYQERKFMLVELFKRKFEHNLICEIMAVEA